MPLCLPTLTAAALKLTSIIAAISATFTTSARSCSNLVHDAVLQLHYLRTSPPTISNYFFVPIVGARLKDVVKTFAD